MTDPRDSRRLSKGRDDSPVLDQAGPRLRLEQPGRRGKTTEAFDLGDFDTQVEDAKIEAEAAQLTLSLTQVIGAQHEIKALLQRLDVASAIREKNEAQRAAGLAKVLITPAELAQAARTGAQTGSVAALDEIAQRVDTAAQVVRSVNERLERDARRREGERDLWIQATMYAAIGGAIAILAGVGGGYMIGRNAGSASGYATARDEVAAASWATTANGAFARQLDRDGSLQQMRDCSGQEWHAEKRRGRRVCFGGAAGERGLQGWYVP